ncbi:hypothetical protein C0J52_27585 [Blattella germanica]|nr:hypothetical protein C0J52_27585 [Blattella germanica]
MLHKLQDFDSIPCATIAQERTGNAGDWEVCEEEGRKPAECINWIDFVCSISSHEINCRNNKLYKNKEPKLNKINYHLSFDIVEPAGDLYCCTYRIRKCCSQVPRVLIVCFSSKKLNLRQLFSVDFEPSMVRILLAGQQFILGTKHFVNHSKRADRSCTAEAVVEQVSDDWLRFNFELASRPLHWKYLKIMVNLGLRCSFNLFCLAYIN